jgi:uncharacterized membrane protein YbhN (UPF0104 family)
MSAARVKLVTLSFYALLLLFLFFYLRGIDFSVFQQAHFVWGYIIIASFLALVSRYWQIFIWFVLLKGLGARDLARSKGQLIYVYAKSWMGRYIPGTAPWILGKIYFASQHGIPKKKLAVSSLLEGALQVSVVMAVASVLLLADSRLNVVSARFKLVIGVVLVMCLLAIVPPVFNRLVKYAYKLLRKQEIEEEHLAGGGTIARGAGLYVIGALVNGVSLFFMAKAIYPALSSHDLFFVMGAGSLASAASMLAIFAPSGVGVRESIQLILLSAIMPKELALLVTVVTRLWSVTIDFIFFGLSKSLERFVFSDPRP